MSDQAEAKAALDAVRRQLRALEAYEISMMRRAAEEEMPWREEEAIDRELLRILEAKGKLSARLKALEGK